MRCPFLALKDGKAPSLTLLGRDRAHAVGCHAAIASCRFIGVSPQSEGITWKDSTLC